MFFYLIFQYLDLFPWLRHLPNPDWDFVQKTNVKMMAFVGEHLRKRRVIVLREFDRNNEWPFIMFHHTGHVILIPYKDQCRSRKIKFSILIPKAIIWIFDISRSALILM